LLTGAVLKKGVALFKGKSKSNTRRMRLPRHFGVEHLLSIYDENKANTQNILYTLFSGRYKKHYYTFIEKPDSKNCLLATNRTLLYLKVYGGTGFQLNWEHPLLDIDKHIDVDAGTQTVTIRVLVQGKYIQKSVTCKDDKTLSNIYTKLKSLVSESICLADIRDKSTISADQFAFLKGT